MRIENKIAICIICLGQLITIASAQVIPPQEAVDSSFFTYVPTVDYGDVMQQGGTTSFTTEFEPAGGFWGQNCFEKDVYLARLKHTANVDDSWDLRIGKGGQIYSFIGPYGEGVPPSYSNHGFNSSRWNDEVWQPVSVSSFYNNADVFPNTDTSIISDNIRSMKYFIHGAGIYINDKIQEGTFYSPLMASYYDEPDKAYYVTNWGQQAHVPSLYKSGLLYTTKYRDIGEGVLEVTYIIQNFGKDVQNHLNMPWGGVRSSNLRGQFISLPDNTLQVSTANTGTSAGLMDIDESAGYFIFANDTLSETSPSLGLVFGNEVRTNEFSDNKLSRIYFRHAQVGGDDNLRDYSLWVLIPKINVNPGDIFYYRFYYVNGTRTFVHEKSKELVPFIDYGFIDPKPEETPLVSIKSADFDNALSQDLDLYASPVKNSVPLFLMENTETGKTYISPDLYYNVLTAPFKNPYSPGDAKYETYQDRVVYKNYSGNIAYKKLLGYGVSSRSDTPDIRYKLLDSLIVDSTRIIVPDEYKRSIWVPVGSCDNCSFGLDPEPLPSGSILYSDFGENRIYRARNPVNLDYSHNVLNPDQTSANISRLTGKVIRQEGSESSFFFEVPGSIDLSGQGTFRLRVYHETAYPIVDPCNIGLILRDSGKLDTQFALWKDVSVTNQWTEFTFDCHQNNPIAQYNQVWLYFSSPDDENRAAGQTFYIDELTGPPIILPLKDYTVTFRVKEMLTDSLLQNVAVIIGQAEKFTDADGETQFTLTEGDYTFRVSHPDYEELESSLELSKDSVIEIELTPGTKAVSFSIYSEKTGNALSNISVMVGENEVLTGINGMAIFDLLQGAYDYSVSHPDYFTTASAMELSKDTTIQVSLVGNKADIKFRVYSEDKPLYSTTIELEGSSLTTNQTGIALFENLTRFAAYAWSASKEGYEDLAGTVSLENDTTVNLSMTLLTSMINQEDQGISLYPNPTQSELIIKSLETISWIEICDLSGALLIQKDVSMTNATIDMSGYPDGVYIAKIYRDGFRTLSKKVLKRE